MTDLSALIKADKGQRATALHLVDKTSFDGWLKAQPTREFLRKEYDTDHALLVELGMAK